MTHYQPTCGLSLAMHHAHHLVCCRTGARGAERYEATRTRWHAAMRTASSHLLRKIRDDAEAYSLARKVAREILKEREANA